MASVNDAEATTPNIPYLGPRMLSFTGADAQKWLVLSSQPLSGDIVGRTAAWPHCSFAARSQVTSLLQGLRNHPATIVGRCDDQIWSSHMMTKYDDNK